MTSTEVFLLAHPQSQWLDLLEMSSSIYWQEYKWQEYKMLTYVFRNLTLSAGSKRPAAEEADGPRPVQTKSVSTSSCFPLDCNRMEDVSPLPATSGTP